MALDSSVRVHSLGLCESETVGPRTRIWAFAHVMAGATIGADCNICGHAFVEDGAVVGDRVTVKNGVLLWARVTVQDDVFLGPGVVFTNDLRPRAPRKRSLDELVPTLVRCGATVGANATIVCGTTIGAYAFVAAGAVVVDDVGAHALVAGNPARPLGWVCQCGQRLDEGFGCGCGRCYQPDGSDGLVDVAPPPWFLRT